MKLKKSGIGPASTFTTDFADWHLTAFEVPKDLLDTLIRKGVDEAFSVICNERTYCRLEGRIDDDILDPTMLEIVIMSEENYEDDIVWTFSLAEVVMDYITNIKDYDREKFPARLRDALRKLADELDACVSSDNK